jgi:peptidoglycan/LPS O-acetylase OafA/YrhL
LKERFFSLNKRRPSALHALDGLRAIAILWVYSYHSIGGFCGGKLRDLLVESHKNKPLPILFTPFQNGDLGVDIFFVLSGFLISFILLKETDKYEGKIDIPNFYRSRCIRLWFAMAPYLLFAGAIGITWGYWLPPLFFVGNLIGG